MNEINQLISTLKSRLKVHGMTYRDLATALDISEASVKRMFASKSMSLERLVEISNLLGTSLAELTHEAALHERRIHLLTEAQEKELVSDEKLLLIAVCALNQWQIDEIISHYMLTEAECIAALTRLDRLRLIRLMPGNRVRLNVARDFEWRPRGPIHHFFASQGLDSFFKSDFSREEEILSFSHAMLTESARAKILSEIRKLKQKLAELHEESLAVPLSKRHGCAMLLAMRRWEPPVFSRLRRKAE